MKKSFVLIGAVCMLLIVGLVILMFAPHHGVTMELVKYTRWPSGAMIRLKNESRSTIRYLAERDGTPMGSPLYHIKKGEKTNPAPGSVRTTTIVNPRTGKPTEVVFFFNSLPVQDPGNQVPSSMVCDLLPGRSVEFFIRIEPGELPQQIGTIYFFRQVKVPKQIQALLVSVKRFFGIRYDSPGQAEVWCREPLSVPLTGERGH